MEITKYFCDLCEKEVDCVSALERIRIKDKRYYICCGCMNAYVENFKKFVENLK